MLSKIARKKTIVLVVFKVVVVVVVTRLFGGLFSAFFSAQVLRNALTVILVSLITRSQHLPLILQILN